MDEQMIPPPPGTSKRDVALALYRPPFKFMHGYIFDADGQMVADQDGGHGLDGKAETHIIARVRGWGRIQKINKPELRAEQLQDEVGEMLAQALTEFWQRAQGQAQGEKQ